MAIPRDVLDYVAENRLTRRSGLQSNARTLAVIGIYAGISFTCFALSSPVAWVIGWLIQALILAGAYSAMHEAAHNNLYESRSVNRIAGFFWGMSILINFSLYRAFHLQHHAYTRVKGDPEPQNEFASLSQYIFGMPFVGFAYVGGLWSTSLLAVTGRAPWYARTEMRKRDIRLDGVLFLIANLAVIGALVVWPMLVFKIWLVPLLITYASFVSMTALPEHYLCGRDADVFHTTRSVISNAPFRFLYWNNNYHAAHHLYPGVPYQNVPALHRLVADRTIYLSPSYLSVHLDVIRSFRQEEKPAVDKAA